jgi:glycosyltransferase involved in cell wall biosynthesis
VNLGQGAALQTGIDFALLHGARFVVTFDSDGQHRAEEIGLLVDALLDRGCDVALGTRFSAGGRAVNISRMRKLVLRLAVRVSRYSTGLEITDTHNGFRAMTRAAATRIRITQNRMAHASQILDEIARLSMSYVEVPVTVQYTDYSLKKGQRMSNAFNIIWESLTGRIG